MRRTRSIGNREYRRKHNNIAEHRRRTEARAKRAINQHEAMGHGHDQGEEGNVVRAQSRR